MMYSNEQGRLETRKVIIIQSVEFIVRNPVHAFRQYADCQKGWNACALTLTTVSEAHQWHPLILQLQSCLTNMYTTEACCKQNLLGFSNVTFGQNMESMRCVDFYRFLKVCVLSVLAIHAVCEEVSLLQSLWKMSWAIILWQAVLIAYD